jgi:glycosyltransferase involved in cell wall biosynthesis
MPKVSVIIPCFNHGKYIEETIKSVLMQTFRDLEIIIVNDGSTDGDTIKILDELKRKYAGIIFLDQKNGHLANARNNGVKASSGEFFLPLDADDKIDATMLEKCLNVIENDEKLGFIYTYTKLFGDNNEIIARAEYNFYDLLQMNYIVATSLIRKQAWEKIGGYDENMKNGYEDWEFYIRLGKNGWFGKLLKEPLFCYRKHGESMVDDAIKKHVLNFNYIKERHSDIYNEKKINEIKLMWKSKNILGRFKGEIIRQLYSIKFKLIAAGVAKKDDWKKHPLRTLFRFVPIGIKKKINNIFHKNILDVSYFGEDINKK